MLPQAPYVRAEAFDPYEGKSAEFRYWMQKADHHYRMARVCEGVAEREEARHGR